MRLTHLLISLLAASLLAGCPTVVDEDPCDVEGALEEDLDDDGDPDCSDDTPTGTAPVINSVEVCEVAVLPDGCQGNLAAEFRIGVTDEDCNFDNPPYIFTQDGDALVDGRVEGSLGCGGTLRIQLCNEWARGFDFPFELWVQDDLGNDSNVWEGSWFVPAAAGDDNCGPL